MNQVNYAAMSDRELRQYFLSHREDKTALQIYLERLGTQPQDVITTVDDPDFNEKMQAAILRKMQVMDGNSETAV
jgi:hypothetical protein